MHVEHLVGWELVGEIEVLLVQSLVPRDLTWDRIRAATVVNLYHLNKSNFINQIMLLQSMRRTSKFQSVRSMPLLPNGASKKNKMLNSEYCLLEETIARQLLICYLYKNKGHWVQNPRYVNWVKVGAGGRSGRTLGPYSKSTQFDSGPVHCLKFSTQFLDPSWKIPGYYTDFATILSLQNPVQFNIHQSFSFYDIQSTQRQRYKTNLRKYNKWEGKGRGISWITARRWRITNGAIYVN